MAIPDFQTIMLPLLRAVGDSKEHSLRDTVEALARYFVLSETERTALLPSGRQAIFDNRVGWARTYMKKTGLLESPRRAIFRISQRGLEVLKTDPPRIDIAFLEKLPEFKSFRALRHEKGPEEQTLPASDGSTPEETFSPSRAGTRSPMVRARTCQS